MGAYIRRRLLQSILVVWGVSVLVFFLLRLAPGDPVSLLLAESASPEQMEAVREKWGLNEPIPVQYMVFLSRALRGDLGDSLFFQQPAMEVLLERLPATLQLSAAALLFWCAGRLQCPVVLHLDVPFLPDAQGKPVYQPHWYGGGAEPLARTLAACPDTVFIGHAPGFWRFISGDEAVEQAVYPKGPVVEGGRLLELFDSFPNLWADLSAGSGLGAMQRDVGFARTFLTRYADRILFGRDDNGNRLQSFLLSLQLDEDVLEKILVGNALRLVPG